MKAIKVITLILCLASFSAMAQFEGVIEMTGTDVKSGQDAQISWYIKGTNHKMSMNGSAEGQSFNYDLVMTDPSRVSLLTEIDGKPSIFTVPVSQIQATVPVAMNAKVVESSTRKQIAGKMARKINVYGENSEIELWVTEDLSLSVAQLPAFLQQQGVFKTLQANNLEVFPLAITMTGSDGQVIYQHEVTSIMPGKLSAQEFDTSNYTEGSKNIELKAK